MKTQQARTACHTCNTQPPTSHTHMSTPNTKPNAQPTHSHPTPHQREHPGASLRSPHSNHARYNQHTQGHTTHSRPTTTPPTHHIGTSTQRAYEQHVKYNHIVASFMPKTPPLRGIPATLNTTEKFKTEVGGKSPPLQTQLRSLKQKWGEIPATSNATEKFKTEA